jgi:hypothetical protein
VASSALGLNLNRWPLVELVLLAALVFEGWRLDLETEPP